MQITIPIMVSGMWSFDSAARGKFGAVMCDV